MMSDPRPSRPGSCGACPPVNSREQVLIFANPIAGRGQGLNIARRLERRLRADGKLFLLMTGVGFDAAVVHELDRVRRGPIGYVDYLLPAALALRGYEYPSLRVTVDGREVWRPAPAVAFVGNVREYGTGFPILPDARPDDGQLDICVMPCRTPFDLARLFLQSLSGEHLREEGVVYLRGRLV